MCGIAGHYYRDNNGIASLEILSSQVHTLTHRGPDDWGFHRNDHLAFGMRRLSIIDLSGGQQPISNENGSMWIVFNGEIFNYLELTELLKRRGHIFRTKSDTETILHAYEEFGDNFASYLNGQFAIALWDNTKHELILARDRMGICPLYFGHSRTGAFVFGSEIKSILAFPGMPRALDPVGLDQMFSLWVTIPPQTVYQGISELRPGHIMRINTQGEQLYAFWKLRFPSSDTTNQKSLNCYVEELQFLLEDSIRLRLRADVAVGSYLSGGLDSSIISSLASRLHRNKLRTFSVSFADSQFDESIFQKRMADYLGTKHQSVEATYESIGCNFSDVIKFAEVPSIRTAPAPLFILSKMVHESGIKVVLTGEGADEVFAGYDIFKEDSIRRFWARFPESSMRPELFSRIYPDIRRSSSGSIFWRQFFKQELNDVNILGYSHRLRWNNTAHIKCFFSPHFREKFNEEYNVYEPLKAHCPNDIHTWHHLSRAQYLESTLFLPGYLLSTQGDRMMMGNSIEGRFPFLDHRIVEFGAGVPPLFKLFGLNEKFILKKAFSHIIPMSINYRQKKPYRAPINQCFAPRHDNVSARMLDPEIIEEYGIFENSMVSKLRGKMIQYPDKLSERDNMAVASIVSTQLVHHHFIKNPGK